jgi:Protein of unknown function (DUF3574)
MLVPTGIARFLVLAGLTLACAPAMPSDGIEPVITDRLYFGRTTADSLVVTDSAWAGFLRDVVSSRLPSGFTYWVARGEWRGPDGRVRREPSFVLEVVHPPRSAPSDSVILGIIAEYKRRFSQESVLRVITSGRASF